MFDNVWIIKLYVIILIIVVFKNIELDVFFDFRCWVWFFVVLLNDWIMFN